MDNKIKSLDVEVTYSSQNKGWAFRRSVNPKDLTKTTTLRENEFLDWISKKIGKKVEVKFCNEVAIWSMNAQSTNLNLRMGKNVMPLITGFKIISQRPETLPILEAISVCREYLKIAHIDEKIQALDHMEIEWFNMEESPGSRPIASEVDMWDLIQYINFSLEICDDKGWSEDLFTEVEENELHPMKFDWKDIDI